MTATPELSAVVVNYDGGPRLLACIRSLQDLGDGIDEIILVDNGSRDGSADQVATAFPAVRIVRLNDNPGPATARNRGLAAARHRHVLLVDADTRVTPGAVAALVAGLKELGGAVACPRLVLGPGEARVQCDGAAPHIVGSLLLHNANGQASEGGAPHPVDGIISTFLLVDRDRSLDAGGFNEAFFFYFEDLEFGLRMRLLGHRIVCVPSSIVVHDRGEGYAGLSFRGAGDYPARRAYYSMRNRLFAIAICFHWRTILVLFPVFVLYECATVGLALVKGWLPEWARGWRWLLANRHLIRRMRTDVQSRRVVRDRTVLTGGPLPLADGLLRNPVALTLVAALSAGVTAYWRLVRVAVH